MAKDYSCRCGCGLNNIDNRVEFVIRSLEISLGAEVTVTSACRCKQHHINIYLKMGKKLEEIPMGSFHIKCEAADVQVGGFSAQRIMRELKALFGDQLYMYAINERTGHFDIRYL